MNMYKVPHEKLLTFAADIADMIRSNQRSGFSPTAYPVPRGGVPAAYLVKAAYDKKYAPDVLLIAEVPEQADHFIDDIIDSGKTRDRYAHNHPGIPFYALVNKPWYKDALPSSPLCGWVVFPWESNEDEVRLQEIVDMAPYVCVSPRNDLPEKSRVAWSQYVHGLQPQLKSHGLATTGAQMLTTVPWHSADSASWVFAGAMGGITILLDQKLISVSMSDESPSRRNMNKHFDTMPDIMRERIAARIDHHGFTVDEIKTGHGERMAFNMLETMAWMAVLETNVVEQPSLFGL